MSLFAAGGTALAQPTVSAVTASQRAGTREVAITYTLSHPLSTPCRVTVQASRDNGVTWETVSALTGAAWGGITPGAGKSITWSASSDWPALLFPQVQIQVTADDEPPGGMILLPAGTFMMGDYLDGMPDALTHAVTLSAFYMAKTETTFAEWGEVRLWGAIHGYTDIPPGAGKAATHPVQTVSWYNVVKWLNAKSERDGLVPAYYTNDAQTTVYRTGDTAVTNTQVKWTASGYRLPTEAEWEYAARGGLAGKRFPWGDTITHVHSNYTSYGAGPYPYDASATGGNHPTYATGGVPYTSPAGSFAANGYGLQDMAGNVWEWCWDWYGSYGSAAVTAPLGPISGAGRVSRGGGWDNPPSDARSARRYTPGVPGAYGTDYVGFRAARSSVP